LTDFLNTAEISKIFSKKLVYPKPFPMIEKRFGSFEIRLWKPSIGKKSFIIGRIYILGLLDFLNG
jgi:hypothetical protein